MYSTCRVRVQQHSKNVYVLYSLSSKFPDLLIQFKTLLGFKEPSGADVSPDTSPPPQFPSKDRVTEFAAEIG